MHDYQRDFIASAIEADVLSFGSFTLKSGRISPYFFNAGLFHDGRTLGMLGHCYAEALERSGLECDVLFGPAYKGIPLVAATSVALSVEHQRNLPYAYNRKEAKDHGEGGTLVGAPLKGDVVIVDDVITAGTAINEALDIIRGQGARPAGIVVALDREERGKSERSAIEEIKERHGIPVIPIVTLSNVLDYLMRHGNNALQAHAEEIRLYRDRYGVKS